MTCIRLSVENVIALHHRLISKSGGIDGVRDFHPFLDGNKRIGILAMMVFLKMNGLQIICTDNELETLGWGLADGSISEAELLDWVVSHS